MKKKILIILAMTFLLVGCGKTSKFTMQLGSESFDEKLDNMEIIANSTLTDAYNLDLTKMDEYVFKQNTNGDFYAIIKTDEPTTIKSEMSEYFKRVKDFNSSYSPERLSLLENRLEKQLDNYLIYIIAENSDDIYNYMLDKLD